MPQKIIKFRFEKVADEISDSMILVELLKYRNKLYSRGFIGVGSNGICYGNISVKNGRSFYITGCQTGAVVKLEKSDLCEVVGYDFDNNSVTYKGWLEPSSESLSHAIFYDKSPAINSVIHVHSHELWEKYQNEFQTTSKKAEYGTIKLVREIEELLSIQITPSGFIVTLGHEPGLLIYGSSLEAVYDKLEEIL